METKFLTELGIDEEVAKKVIIQNGKDIEHAKTTVKTYETEFKEAQETLDTVQNDLKTLKESNASAEDFKAKFEEYKTKFEDAEKARKEREEADKKAAQDKILADRFDAITADKKWVNDHTKSGVLADWRKAVESGEHEGKSDAEIFTQLTKDTAGLYQGVQAVRLQGVANMGGDADVQAATAKARAVMGLPDKKE